MNNRQRKKKMKKFFLSIPEKAFLRKENIMSYIKRLESELCQATSIPTEHYAQTTHNAVVETKRLLG
jgi:hypothetical protein